MNRLKVSIAKEKISRLREKYSKNPSKEGTSSSESLKSIQIERSPKRNEISSKENSESFGKQKQVEKNYHNDISLGRSREDFDPLKAGHQSHDDEDVTQGSQSAADAEHPVETPLSPESLVVSDLSIQFERIRFISSSSENVGIFQSESTQSKSISTDENRSRSSIGQNKQLQHNPNKNYRGKKCSKVEDNYLKISNNNGKTISPISFPETESNDSTISSVKEVDSGSVSHNSSLLEVTIYSNNETISDSIIISGKNYENDTESSQNNYSLSIIEKKSVKEINDTGTALQKTLDNVNHSNSNASSSNPRSKQVKGQNKKMQDSLEKFSSEFFSQLQLGGEKHTRTKSNEYLDKSTNTDPVKVLVMTNQADLSKFESETRFKRPVIKKNECKKIFIKKCNANSKHSSQRSFVKPCKLIKNDEIKSIELKNILHQELVNSPSFGILGNSSEEVIYQLLKNQIMLTRHFIESHHHMYLQVCNAAQLLNKNSA